MMGYAMSSTLITQHYTAAEYLALERAAETKSELIGGEIVAMAGTSLTHADIASNILFALRQCLKGKPCKVVAADIRVQIDPQGTYVYPDVIVTCGKRLYGDSHLDTLLNPTVIFEILSPSTEARDRGEKWKAYQRLGSLQDYLLVSQDQKRIEHYQRQGDLWVFTVYEGEGTEVSLASLGGNLPLAEVYEGIEG